MKELFEEISNGKNILRAEDNREISEAFIQ